MEFDHNYFSKTSRIIEEYKRLGLKETKALYEVKDLALFVNQTYQSEYDDYLNRKEYFPGCPFSLYVETYNQRLESFLNKYPDAAEIDFVIQEDQIYWKLMQMDNDNSMNYYSFYPYLKSDPFRYNIEYSISKLNKFLDQKVIKLGHYFYPAGNYIDDISAIPRSMWEIGKNDEVIINEVLQDSRKSNISNKEILRETKEVDNEKLSHPVIALIYIYENKIINNQNKQAIAEGYGWNSPTSGHNIYMAYLKYYPPKNRTGNEGTKKKNMTKINYIETAIGYLSERSKIQAFDELNTLKTITEVY